MPLLHPADFDRAMWFQLPVIVTQDGEQIGSGTIEKHTDETVKIEGAYYVKAACMFETK